MKKFFEENIKKPTDEMMKLVNEDSDTLAGIISDFDLMIRRAKENINDIMESPKRQKDKEKDISLILKDMYFSLGTLVEHYHRTHE